MVEIVAENILSFTLKKQKKERFDYVITSIKYIIVLGKIQVSRQSPITEMTFRKKMGDKLVNISLCRFDLRYKKTI